MKPKILIEKPLLEIKSARDGVFLFFTDKKGNSGGINLGVYFDKDCISHRAIRQWVKEYAKANPVQYGLE